MKRITSLLLSGLLLLGLSSCLDHLSITGNGVRATENRTVPVFSKVKSGGSFTVYITNGEETSVTLSADENLLQYIETYVSGETLYLDIEELHNVKAVIPMEIYITTPDLNGIKQSGSGSVTADFYEADHFDLILSGSGSIHSAFESNTAEMLLSGSGKIKVSGNVNVAEVTISGSGEIDGADLDVTKCHTFTSGSGNMWLSVENQLEIRISGSGNVYYYGNPSVATSISGSGNVINKD